ncbi:MAG: hypothetical protein GOMPHAMPRED_004493 [Gomphillus americanus]|uniref:Uncharacterized protein n=1 Tax=Gomphillus americanus TaxID=1940652 RepID=A0A8H3FKT2_9LECA|nr:MAG: hypothetical protein GOMPHAMPRED_004493 [Gomphillus americanus]
METKSVLQGHAVLQLDGVIQMLHIAIPHPANLYTRAPVRAAQNRLIQPLMAIVDLAITTPSVLLDNAVLQLAGVIQMLHTAILRPVSPSTQALAHRAPT